MDSLAIAILTYDVTLGIIMEHASNRHWGRILVRLTYDVVPFVREKYANVAKLPDVTSLTCRER